MKAVKRSLAMLLALMLCVGMLSLNAFAEAGRECPKCGAELGYSEIELPTCEKPGHNPGYYCTEAGCDYDERGILPAGHDPKVSWTLKDGYHVETYACGHEASRHEADKNLPNCPLCRGTTGPIACKHPSCTYIPLGGGTHYWKCAEKSCGVTGMAACVYDQTGDKCVCGAEKPHTHTWEKQPDGSVKCECGETCAHTDCTYKHLDGNMVEGTSRHNKVCNKCGFAIETANCQYKVSVQDPEDCTVQGTVTKICKLCGAKGVQNNGEPYQEHSFTVEVAEGSIPATCEDEGVQVMKCARCPATKTVILAKLECEDKDGDGNCDHCGGSVTCEHSEYETLGTVEAGCENFGTEQRKCKKCGHVWNEILALKLGHDFQDTGATHDTATCEAGGSKTQYCSRCDATQEVATDRLSHQYGDLIAEVPATCAADGVRAHYMCQLCKKNYVGTKVVTDEELKIEKLPHTPGTAVRENVVAATETTGGSYDLVTRCTVCNEVITSVHRTTAPTGTGTGTTIPDPDVPLGGDPDDGVVIDEPEVPLAGLASRAEFVDYLYRQSGSPEAGLPTFTDVPADHEYAPAIGWAEENGITLGVGGGCFDPDGLVTVEQANLFLERYAKLYGMEMPELAALAGKEDDDIVDNASEVMDEFFGADA